MMPLTTAVDRLQENYRGNEAVNRALVARLLSAT